MSYRKVIAFLIVIGMAFFLNSCSKSGSVVTGGIYEPEKGTLSLSVVTGRVGALAKSTAINLAELHVELSSPGQESINEIYNLDGSGRQTVAAKYKLTPDVEWTVTVESKDSEGVTVHSGERVFTIAPAENKDLLIELDAIYSMIVAGFSPVDSRMDTCKLIIDGESVSSAPSTVSGSETETVTLSYDYVRADETHNIRLEVWGEKWNINYLLYSGEIDIEFVSGVDASYSVRLDWVGPDTPPNGRASIDVDLGAVAVVSIDGVINK